MIKKIFSHRWLLFFLSLPFLSFSKTILITGGAGFIGSSVSQALLARGDSVIIVDNLNDSCDKRLKLYNLSCVKKSSFCSERSCLTTYITDICNYHEMEKIIDQERPDVICHLAARAGVRHSIQNPQEYLRTNINGTTVIYELAQKYGIKHIVTASSSSVYGECLEKTFSEDNPAAMQSSQYGFTKRAVELLGYVYHHLYGTSITNLRFFTVYGPRGRVDMAPFIFIDAIHNGKNIVVYGDGSSIRDFTYIGDIVAGVLGAIDHPQGYQIINLGRGNPVQVSDFITTIENVVGKKAAIVYQSAYAGDVTRTHADIARARIRIGYEPIVSLHEGLIAMYAWYINEYQNIITAQESTEMRSGNALHNNEVYVFPEDY